VALVYVGKLSLSALCPIVAASIGDVGVSLNAGLTGNLAVNASFSATPPDIASILAGLAQFQAQLSAAISLGVPSVSFDVSAAASLVTKLNLSFSLLVALDALLSVSIGAYTYSYVGTADAMGAALTTELATQWPDGAPTSTATQAMLFGAVNDAALLPPSIGPDKLKAFLNGLGYGAGLQYAGRVGLSGISVVAAGAIGQGHAAIQSQLDGALALQASAHLVPPTLAVTAALVAEYAARFLLSVPPLPSASFALAATAAAAANLSAKFGGIIDLGASLSRLDAAVFAYTYAGTGAAFGADVTTVLAATWGDGTTPTSGPCVSAILASTDPVTWATLSSFFGGV
jgi:hypothetical protein